MKTLMILKTRWGSEKAESALRSKLPTYGVAGEDMESSRLPQRFSLKERWVFVSMEQSFDWSPFAADSNNGPMQYLR
jgi:hypothetical protein